MSRSNAVILILGVVLVGTMLWRGLAVRVPAYVDSTTSRSVLPDPVISRAASMTKPNAVAPARSPGSVPAAPTAETVEPVQPFERELQSYSELKRKVFLTPEEQAHKETLLKNPDVLRGLRARLVRSPVNGQQALAQNAAIDMLLEALKSGDSEVASEVLRTVVTDGQVEDTKTDPLTRENLAGVKAEVLFQWSALKPAQSDELAQMLPGPVSQRIWANVISAQQSNLNESANLGE